MSSDYAFALQQAIYTKLKTDNAVAGGRVYDDAPSDADRIQQSGAAFPYVEIGESQSIPDDVSGATESGDEGISEFVDLHIWSRKAGMKEAKDIGTMIHVLLHEVSLVVAGRASANAYVRNKRFFRDPDGKTRHGVVTVEVIHRS
jgi:hypothetical protein